MGETVEIHLRRPAEGQDLLRALSVRGLTGSLATDADGAVIAIERRHEGLEHLLADLLPALDEWRADVGLKTLDLRVGQRRYALHGHGDIARCLADLRSRPAVVAA